MAAGLTSPTSGNLVRRSDKLAYVFQDPTLLAWRNVRSNVELIAKLRGVDRAERRARADKALRLVGLEQFERALPRELSGGMKMRVSLARAITSDPDLMLMDEPFAALDEFTRDKMASELLRLWRANSFAVMFITHSIREAVAIGHRIVVMGAGPGHVKTIVESPSPPSREEAAPRDERALADLAETISAMLAGEHN
jgi:NitT/TauT family transport system ATP-binding protein